MKIVYIIETLVSNGGTERMVSEKANYLAEKLGHDVYIIVCTQQQNQPNAYHLSRHIKQIYLGIPLYSQYKYKYPKRLWIKQKIENEFRYLLTKEIQSLDPDILIGMGHFKADVICNIECKAKKIIECHEARYFTLSGMSQHQNFISKIYLYLFRKKYFKIIETKADAVVTLTQGDKQLWNKARYVEVIPNFSPMPIQQTSSCETKRIIAVGRLSWEKGYDRLLSIWKEIERKYPDWHLDVFGEGELEKNLKFVIARNGLKNITIRKFTYNISHEYANSSICVLTSYYEGFALTLLEALKHGVPCVAFDCPFGPASIIENNKCGFLVKDSDINKFVEKLSLLMKDTFLRKAFSKAAIKRSEYFSIDFVMSQWETLFKKL